MNRRQYQEQLRMRQEKQNNINNRYFILSCMMAFLLLVIASFMLDDAIFNNNWSILRYLVALACFILSVVLLITGDRSKIKIQFCFFDLNLAYQEKPDHLYQLSRKGLPPPHFPKRPVFGLILIVNQLKKEGIR